MVSGLIVVYAPQKLPNDQPAGRPLLPSPMVNERLPQRRRGVEERHAATLLHGGRDNNRRGPGRVLQGLVEVGGRWWSLKPTSHEMVGRSSRNNKDGCCWKL